jgi:response regulator RpfG family c-di-GMP phosphodiesterase
VRCIEAGAVDYLSKPFDPTLLYARISSTLEIKHLRDREQLMLAEIKREKERNEDLLLSILPRGIIDRINQGETMIADDIVRRRSCSPISSISPRSPAGFPRAI